MLRNFFKTAIRNLVKQRFYTLINVAGLAVGIACCLLIMRYVQHELSYDRHHAQASRIYRLTGDLKLGDNEFHIAVMSAPMAKTLLADYPEVEAVARLRQSGAWLVRPADRQVDNIKETRITYADPSLFDIFTIPVLDGEVRQGLAQPNTIAISRTMADKYFPGQQAVGQQLLLDNDLTLKVVAVYEDFPDNSHLHLDMLISMENREEAQTPYWMSFNFQTYVLMKEGADVDAFAAKLPGLVEKYIAPELLNFTGVPFEELKKAGSRIEFALQPLREIHFSEGLVGEIEPGSDRSYVYIFSAVALFILLIACINFMNLSTARSANRAREVGVRKVLGSHRYQLVWQFLAESILISCVAFALALVLASAALPYFQELSGKALELPFGSWWFLSAVLLGGLVVGLLAGVYPAFFLSGFEPVHVLKGRLSRGASSSTLRSALVVIQFTASIVLIFSTAIVYQQLRFVQNKKIGFDKSQVLIIDDTYSIGDKVYALKEALGRHPQVQAVTASNYLPVEGFARNNNAFWPRGSQNREQTTILQNWTVDHDYVSTMSMEVILGRDFARDMPTDSQGVILNETAVQRFGFTMDSVLYSSIDTYADYPDETGNAAIESYPVIGVVRDFHYESLRESVAPLGLFLGRNTASLSVRARSSDMSEVLAAARDLWREFAPGQPFTYTFMDERFMSMYRAEQRVGKIFATFAGLAIFVACLGLFALATFMAEQRTKEIGIRKVMGASVWQIVTLMSRDFMVLVGIAILLAVLIGFPAMANWLRDYAFRVDLYRAGILAMMLVALGSLVIAFATISSQAIRAAVANPADALRDE
ncbi:MAG: ABC transporter permease [Bacteroidia bacterium]